MNIKFLYQDINHNGGQGKSKLRYVRGGEKRDLILDSSNRFWKNIFP